MDQENNCIFVSSRGILKSCDIYNVSIRKLSNYDFSKLKSGLIIYICSSNILRFINTVSEKMSLYFSIRRL